MNIKVGQKFKHFDGKDYCICIITKINDSKRVHLVAITDYHVVTWWEELHSFRTSRMKYYYRPITYDTKLGKILYK